MSDVERESLSKRLADEFEAGRIDHDTYNNALDTIYDAKTLGELVPVAKVVPDVVGEVPAIVGRSKGEPGELAPVQSRGMAPLVLGGIGLATVLAILVLLLVIL